MSANRTDLDALDDRDWKLIRRCLESFDLIGVRDQLTEELVERAGCRWLPRVVRTPDPTFLVELPEVDIDALTRRSGWRAGRPAAGLALADKVLRRALNRRFRESGLQVGNLLSYDVLADVNGLGKLGPFHVNYRRTGSDTDHVFRRVRETFTAWDLGRVANAVKATASKVRSFLREVAAVVG